MTAPLISLRAVSKSFKDGRVRAVEDITLDVGPGEFVSLVGPSGCGKTTLLRLIDGLIAPDAGEVLVRVRMLAVERRVAQVHATQARLSAQGVPADAPEVTAALGELWALQQYGQRLREQGAAAL